MDNKAGIQPQRPKNWPNRVTTHGKFTLAYGGVPTARIENVIGNCVHTAEFVCRGTIFGSLIQDDSLFMHAIVSMIHA